MTVYFMGTELEDFPNRGGTVGHTVSASFRRTANTRQAIYLLASVEDSSLIDTDSFSSTELWVHMIYACGGSTGTPNNVVKWYSGGTQQLAFRWSAVSGTLEIRKWTGAAWTSLATVTDTGLYGLPTSATSIVFYVKLGNPGEFRVYYNNMPAISRNDLDLSGIGSIDKIRFCPATSSQTCYTSEVIVADYNLVGSKIVSRPPTGNGTYQEWTNGAFGIVDDTDATGADLATSGTVDQRTTYTHAAFTALGASEVLTAVKVSAAVNRDAAGPQNINFMTRIGSTDYNGADTALNVSQTRVGKIWETSPATAVAWTVTELNAAQMGVRSRT